MQDTHPIAFLIPVAVGVAAIICTILIHALPLSATINIVRRETAMIFAVIQRLAEARYADLKD